MFYACFYFFGAVMLVKSDSDGFGKTWNYDKSSNIGPANWFVHYPKCGGSKQSPIDIVPKNAVYEKALKPLVLTSYDNAEASLKYTMRNSGSTAITTISSNNIPQTGIPQLTFNDNKYKLLQFHFHWGSVNTQGSEHTLNGKSFPAEVHLVHYNTKYNAADAGGHPDGLLVWGQFIQVNGQSDNANLANVITRLKDIKYEHTHTNLEPFPISFLVPPNSEKTYYTYPGSLTTPGCNEAVTWLMNKNYLVISQAQMDEFRQLSSNKNDSEYQSMSNNYRPVQKLNQRVVKKSFPGETSKALYEISNLLLVVTAIVVALMSQ